MYSVSETKTIKTTGKLQVSLSKLCFIKLLKEFHTIYSAANLIKSKNRERPWNPVD